MPVQLFVNQHAKKVQADSVELAMIAIQSTSLVKHYKERVLDLAIWKYSESHFVIGNQSKRSKKSPWGEKYACRYYSKNAWEQLKDAETKRAFGDLRKKYDCQLEHVFARKAQIRCLLSGDLVSGGQQLSQDWLKSWFAKHVVTCVVTKAEEHTKLEKNKKQQGWRRYEQAGISMVYQAPIGDITVTCGRTLGNFKEVDIGTLIDNTHCDCVLCSKKA